jgi:hypothetical protein
MLVVPASSGSINNAAELEKYRAFHNDPCLRAWITAAVKNIDVPMFTRVWQELEYRIDVCRVTRCAHIELL